jgi:phosphoribosylaminoimidazole-succinocarboxamide synthase
VVQTVTKINVPGLTPTHSGKVRDIFDLGDKILLVASDRISAFDCILPQGIPEKGAILTQMAKYWFDTLPEAKPHHLITTELDELPDPFYKHPETFAMRSTLVKKVKTLPVECIVRGYLAGSGWNEYQERQTICGIDLPAGLRESEELPTPLFTPSTKAVEGHDENISFDEVVTIIGGDAAEEIRYRSLSLYKSAAKLARENGVIIADTKFEFGELNGEIILIDEILTPDSSRFWEVADYEPGRSQKAFDKQFVRDYLNSLDWDKTPPAPDLPDEIIINTLNRYKEAFRMITGKEWGSDS